METTDEIKAPDGEPYERVLGRSLGRDVIDMVRAHALDGGVGLADMIIDGQPVEVIARCTPVDPADPDGDQNVAPIAIVVTAEMAERMAWPE